jgi:integrase
MPQLKLTEIGIQAIKPPESGQVDYFDKHLASFGLRVSSKGAKSFFVMTRVQGKLIRVTLGRYQDSKFKRTNGGSPCLSLKDARGKAGEVIDLAAAGTDPRHVEREQKERDREAASNTFKHVANEFMAKYARVKLRPNTIDEYERALFGADAEHLHRRPISKITKRDILQIMDDMRARGAPTSADRTLAYLRKFFNWAADRDYLAHPPTDRVRAVVGLTERDRSLSKEEIAAVWRAFEQEQGYRRTEADAAFLSLFGPFLKLLLLTGQRTAEVAEMEWKELLDLNGSDPLWVMPKASPPPADQRTKNGLPHIVPLSPLAVEILRGIPPISERFVFSTTGGTPISGFSRLKQRIDGFISDKLEAKGLPPMEPWQFRDLRRTVSTHMNDFLGVDSHVVEAILNHVSGQAKKGVAGTYNKALYLNQRRSALVDWARYIQKLLA